MPDGSSAQTSGGRARMTKLLIIGLALVILMLCIWVIWGELIVRRVRARRPLDDMDLRGR